MSQNSDDPKLTADASGSAADNVEPPEEDMGERSASPPQTTAPSSLPSEEPIVAGGPTPQGADSAPAASQAPPAAQNSPTASLETARSGAVADHSSSPPGNNESEEELKRPAFTTAVYSQQLWEVQLLLDFLSGNPTRKLPDPVNAQQAGLPVDWIEQVCKMTWPPTGTAVQQADQEALLVRVKDYLNGMASPASGFSVAFTLLVTQEDGSGDQAKGARRPAVEAHTMPTSPGMTESRSSLARKAYPDLIRKSKSFRRGIGWIAIALTFWLAITCFLSWYAALGNTELGQLATAQNALDATQIKILAAESAQSTEGASSTGGSTLAKPSNSAVQAAIDSGVSYCDQSTLLGTAGPQHLQIYVSPTQADVCAANARAREDLTAARGNINNWLVFHRKPEEASREVYYATASVAMLGTAILPVCYGIIGAAAAVLRLLSRRMRLSLLTPRDLSLSIQQLALGAVIGACIGLFVITPGGDGTTPSELLGPVKLSGSALSFVGGFGVDAVFAALEALIARIFNTAPSTPK